MDSDSNEVPDLQDPQPVSSGIDDEVIEIIPDPRAFNPVKAEPVVQTTNAAAELDAMCKSLLPKTLTEFPSSSSLPVIGPPTKFHGPPNRRIPQTDWELFDHGSQTYLIIREEKNRGFIRQYASVNGRTFECCYCIEKTGKSVTATATKNAEGRYVVIAAVDHIHSSECPPIPYKFCIKFNQSENIISNKQKGINMKVKKTAMKAAQLGSIQSIIENLTVPKPTLEFQEKMDVLNGNFPTTSAVKPKVKIFSINPSSCRTIPDEDWEYGIGIRGEPKGVIIVKARKDIVREFRLLKSSQDGKMSEYYCTVCQHKYGRTIKVYIETSASGKETAKVLIAKPHAEPCKGIPLSEAYEKQRAVEHRFAKQAASSESEARAVSPEFSETRIPLSRWRFALSPDGVPNATLLVQASISADIYREYRWVPEVSNSDFSKNEMVYKCKFCEEKNKNVPALLNITNGKLYLSESPPSDHVTSCIGESLENLMMNQVDYGRRKTQNQDSSNLQYFMKEINGNGSVNINVPGISDILTACLDLETMEKDKYFFVNDEKNKLWIVADDDSNFGYEFVFWKNAGIAGSIFLCKGCQEVKKKTKAFVRDSDEGLTVQADQNHHSRCSSKSLTDV